MNTFSSSRIPYAIGTLTISLMLTTSVAYGQKNNSGSNGAANGQPFRAISQVVDDNRALIDANMNDIRTLQSDVVSINSTINQLSDDLLLIEDRVLINEDDIADLQLRVSGVETDVSALASDLNQLRITHDADIADINAMIDNANGRITALENNLQSLTLSLNGQLAIITSSIDDNALAIDSAVLELTSTTALALSNLLSINALQTQVDSLEGRADQMVIDIADLQTQIDALATRVSIVEDAVHDHDEGLCFSFSNTANEDLVGNDWFDDCVAAAQNGGTTVTVTLKDNAGNSVYQASGNIVGSWTQNQITSTTAVWSQYYSFNHDRLVSLDNGDKLMISGKTASNSGYGGSFGNGYGITVYPTNPNYYNNPKIIATTYRQVVNYVQPRLFTNWTSGHEITWNGGSSFTTAPPSGIAGLEFYGTFEVYVN